jgi:hypothetical protein
MRDGLGRATAAAFVRLQYSTQPQSRCYTFGDDVISLRLFVKCKNNIRKRKLKNFIRSLLALSDREIKTRVLMLLLSS